jgi:hypothetical protein
MSEENRQVLQDAYGLIRAGNKQEATRLLINVLKADRNNADAWWLLANATNDSDKKRQALEQVLRINPAHGAARRALDTLNPTVSPAHPPVYTPPPVTPPPAAPPASPPPRQASPPPQPAFSSSDPFSDEDPFGDSFSPPRPGSASAPADDPFNAYAPPSSRSAPRPAPVDDPFGDPFAAPASPRPAPRPIPVDDPFGDPFGDPFAQPAASAPRGRPAPAGDPFGDPFAGTPQQPYNDAALRQQVARPERKRGTNPLVIILAVVGLIVVVGCGLLVIAAGAGVSMFGNVFGQVMGTAMNDPTLQAITTQIANPTMQAQFSATFQPDSNGIIGNIYEKGIIMTGQPVRARMEADGITNHAYKFTGAEGQQVTIELTAVNNSFDPKVTLLDPDGNYVDSNDDIDFSNDNFNSHLEVTLERGGVYTIVVSDALTGGGDYDLTIR